MATREMQLSKYDGTMQRAVGVAEAIPNVVWAIDFQFDSPLSTARPSRSRRWSMSSPWQGGRIRELALVQAAIILAVMRSDQLQRSPC
jgi:hypothetical protein